MQTTRCIARTFVWCRICFKVIYKIVFECDPMFYFPDGFLIPAAFTRDVQVWLKRKIQPSSVLASAFRRAHTIDWQS